MSSGIEDDNRGAQYFQVPLQHLEANFVGRQDILQQIELYFFAQPAVHPVFVLHGNGGMGKSQIALQFARTRSRHFHKIVWIQSDTSKRMHESFRSVARSLGINDVTTDEDTVTKHVLTELLDGSERILLIYDSLPADDSSFMNMILSEHHSRWARTQFSKVLITTRDRRYLNFETGGSHAAVEPLPPDNAAKLLMKLLGVAHENHSTLQSFHSICSALGCLPLGILQAASYIKVTDTHPQQFLGQLKQEPRFTLRYLDELSPLMPREKRILTVWEDSMERIETNEPFAAKWFTLCSFLDNTIPHKLFEDAREYLIFSDRSGKERTVAQVQIQWLYGNLSSIESWNTTRLYSDVLELKNFSMIKTNTDDDGYVSSSIHPLVQQWGRLRLESQQQKKYLSMASSLIHLCAEKLLCQHNTPRDSTAAYIYQRQLLSHAYSCIDFASNVLKTNIAEIVPIECSVTFAMFLVHEMSYDAAVQMLEIATDKDDIDMTWKASALRVRSLALRRQRKFPEALMVQRKALKEINGLPPEPDTIGARLRAEGEMATIHRDLRDLDEALRLQVDVVHNTGSHFGSEALETLHELSCQARIHAKREEFHQALEIDERVLQIYKRKYPGRVEIWDKMRNLAITYYDLDMYKDAAMLEVEILEGKERLYGTEHLETASALENLALTCRYSGEHERACQLFRGALCVRRKVLGESHEKVQKTARRLEEVEGRIQAQLAREPVKGSIEGINFGNRVDSGLGIE